MLSPRDTPNTATKRADAPHPHPTRPKVAAQRARGAGRCGRDVRGPPGLVDSTAPASRTAVHRARGYPGRLRACSWPQQGDHGRAGRDHPHGLCRGRTQRRRCRQGVGGEVRQTRSLAGVPCPGGEGCGAHPCDSGTCYQPRRPSLRARLRHPGGPQAVSLLGAQDPARHGQERADRDGALLASVWGRGGVALETAPDNCGTRGTCGSSRRRHCPWCHGHCRGCCKEGGK